MKLKIQTLTGETHQIEVENDSTIKHVKREIYRTGKFVGAVRIVKGQDVLPDDSPLAQHNITEGTTVNIVIEPDKQINLKVVCNIRSIKLEYSHSVSIKELKQGLIDSKKVRCLYDDFDLSLRVDEEDKVLDDDSMPLHYYGVANDSELHTVRPFFILKVESPSGKVSFKQISKKATVAELKNMISPSGTIFMFGTKDEVEYTKLDPKKKLTDVLSKGEMVCYIEDRFLDCCWPVVSEGKEVGKVFGHSTETVRAFKLRMQEQLDIPASCATVNYRKLVPFFGSGNREVITQAGDGMVIPKNPTINVVLT